MNVVSDHADIIRRFLDRYPHTDPERIEARDALDSLVAEIQRLRDAGDEVLVAYKANGNLDTIDWRGMVGSMARLRATLDGMS